MNTFRCRGDSCCCTFIVDCFRRRYLVLPRPWNIAVPRRGFVDGVNAPAQAVNKFRCVSDSRAAAGLPCPVFLFDVGAITSVFLFFHASVRFLLVCAPLFYPIYSSGGLFVSRDDRGCLFMAINVPNRREQREALGADSHGIKGIL